MCNRVVANPASTAPWRRHGAPNNAPSTLLAGGGVSASGEVQRLDSPAPESDNRSRTPENRRTAIDRTHPGPEFDPAGHRMPSPPTQLAGTAKPRVVVWLLVFLIRAYQGLVRPFLFGACKFCPSCSEYGIEALRTHGALRGSWLTIRRLARCHPFSRGGLDLVPPTPDQ